jgi:two-component system sensor histidine kinase BaeS
MQRRIVIATAFVSLVTLLVGVAVVIVIQRGVQIRAASELERQAAVTATLIEEDLARLQFRPTDNPGAGINRLRVDLQRSLERAESLGGHDIVEATIAVRERDVAISEPLVLIPALPPDTSDGDVVTMDLDGETMLVAVEVVQEPPITLTVAIGRSQPLIARAAVTIPVMIAILVGAALTVGLGIWFARSLRRRLAGLETAATAVGAGDLAVRAPVDGDDEIASVAVAFNTMTERLDAVRTREREFLMAVSHDLRTPLTTIRGYAEALDAGDIESADIPRVAGVLNAQADQLSRLVEDVMLLGRLEANQFTMRPEPVDIASLVTGVVDGFSRAAADASVKIAVAAPDAGDRMIDPDRMTQVLSNLFENALRYTPEMGAITVTLRSTDEICSIHVHNTGPGIAERDLPRVFDRLYVAERYRAVRPSGSGLGLAIVSELMVAMGGDVRCSSNESAGTVFEVDIPAARL